jgi:hypothetical protein
MDKLRDHYEAVGQAELDKIRLTDTAVFEASLGLVPNMNPQPGEMPLILGTICVVSLAQNLLLNVGPVVRGAFIPSMNCADESIRSFARGLLEEARTARQQANEELPVSQLPAGLKGLKL